MLSITALYSLGSREDAFIYFGSCQLNRRLVRTSLLLLGVVRLSTCETVHWDGAGRGAAWQAEIGVRIVAKVLKSRV